MQLYLKSKKQQEQQEQQKNPSTLGIGMCVGIQPTRSQSTMQYDPVLPIIQPLSLLGTFLPVSTGSEGSGNMMVIRSSPGVGIAKEETYCRLTIVKGSRVSLIYKSLGRTHF